MMAVMQQCRNFTCQEQASTAGREKPLMLHEKSFNFKVGLSHFKSLCLQVFKGLTHEKVNKTTELKHANNMLVYYILMPFKFTKTTWK